MWNTLLEVGIEMEPFSNEAYYLLFSSLANRTRLALIDVLKDEPKTTTEISEALEQQEETIADNLKPLLSCMIVNSQKSGKEHLYSLNKEIVEPLSEILSFHVNKYCPGLEKCIPPQKLKEYMKLEAAKKTYIEHE
jgi:DNA-binding transcriptional ArsR family regulator